MNEQQQPQKPRKGCLFYGCLTVAIISLAALIGLGIGGYVLYKKAGELVVQYTGAEPMELPPTRYTPVEEEQFRARLDAFAKGLAAGEPSVPLVLKGEDLNMLLASNPDLATFAKGVRLKVEGDEIHGIVSLKLGDLGAPFFRDRYLNGEASFQVELEDGRLSVRPSRIVVNGEPLPAESLAALREQNLAEGVNQNANLQATLKKLERIEIRDGAVRVVPKDSPGP